MHLNSEKKKVTVWLAKMPKYLGEQIMKLGNGSYIGSLQVVPTQQGSSCSIKFSDSILSSGIPREHNIEIKDRNNNMYLVSNDRNKMIIEGVINKECFINPVMNADYIRFKKTQKTQSTNHEEKVKVIDYFAEVKRNAKYSSLREMEMLAKKRKQMLQDKKRERLEREDVLEIIFNAFEKHDLWTVRDLADFSGQPVAYIQELVNEICVLNKKDHKNTYELKPEFKNDHQQKFSY